MTEKMQKRPKELSESRKTYLSDLAEYLADLFFEEDEFIDLEVIAKNFRISYCYGNYGDSFEGLLEYHKGSFHIFINVGKHDLPLRHRFSFAHELGHYFIDEHSLALSSGLVVGHPSISGFDDSNLAEIEANYFASCILMPTNRILNALSIFGKFDIDFIKLVSDRFKSSLLAALYRIFFLNIQPLSIVKTIDGQEKSTVLKNEVFEFDLSDKIVLPAASNASIFFTTGFDNATVKTHNLSDWCDADKKKSLYEYCIYYSSINMVVSVLWYDV